MDDTKRRKFKMSNLTTDKNKQKAYLDNFLFLVLETGLPPQYSRKTFLIQRVKMSTKGTFILVKSVSDILICLLIDLSGEQSNKHTMWHEYLLFLLSFSILNVLQRDIVTR